MQNTFFINQQQKQSKQNMAKYFKVISSKRIHKCPQDHKDAQYHREMQLETTMRFKKQNKTTKTAILLPQNRTTLVRLWKN